MRDTLPAPPSASTETSDSGAPRRQTSLGLAPTPPPSLASLQPVPTSAPPISGVGRYSAQSLHDDVILPPSSRPKAAPPSTDPPRRAARKSIRVDDVGPTAITARRDTPLAAKPRVVKRTRPAPAGLDTNEAFLHALLDRPHTVGGLLDITGMPEQELVKIIARFIRLGIAAYLP